MMQVDPQIDILQKMEKALLDPKFEGNVRASICMVIEVDDAKFPKLTRVSIY